ncbi:MAG: LuxR family transcriptional regulator [Marmoricola sp.]
MASMVSDLNALAETVLAEARDSKRGRASHSLSHGDRLTVTLIGLTAGQSLGEHNAPPAATLQLLQGRATLRTRADSEELAAGHMVPIPRVRHDLVAAEDTVALLTVALDG